MVYVHKYMINRNFNHNKMKNNNNKQMLCKKQYFKIPVPINV